MDNEAVLVAPLLSLPCLYLHVALSHSEASAIVPHVRTMCLLDIMCFQVFSGLGTMPSIGFFGLNLALQVGLGSSCSFPHGQVNGCSLIIGSDKQIIASI